MYAVSYTHLDVYKRQEGHISTCIRKAIALGVPVAKAYKMGSYQAAELDGANKFQQFKHIILPSIKTIITLNVILSITGSLSCLLYTS